MIGLNESAKTRKLCRRWTELGAYCIAIVGGQFQERGLPDRYIVYKGYSFWIEFKVGKNQLTTLQRIRLRELKQRGVFACVVRDCRQIEDEGNIFLADNDDVLLRLLRNLAMLHEQECKFKNVAL